MRLESPDSLNHIQDRPEYLQVGDYVYAAVLPPIKNSRKLAIKWSGPLIVNRFE